MSSKWWFVGFSILSACSGGSGGSGGGEPPGKSITPEPKLEAELRPREARVIPCDLEGRQVMLTLPEGGGRVAEYLPRVLLANRGLWLTLSEPDGAQLYRKCLRPELVAGEMK